MMSSTPLAQGTGSQNVPMATTDREVLYAHDYANMGGVEAPYLTRLHRGAWRPAVRQYIFGSQQFSSWRRMHGSHTWQRPDVDRTNLARARAKPVQIWDQGNYPTSWVPLSTYQPNPSQLMAGNINSSYGAGLPLTATDAYSSWYNRFSSMGGGG
jgi:hypothetical protein